MQIIIGLGNPGEQYAKTRHNAGWLALDNLIGTEGWRENKRFRSLMKENGGNVFLKPLTFMNMSGISALAASKYYHLIERRLGFTKKGQDLSHDLLVIHDDLDLPLGSFRISNDSRSGGQKGVQSIIDHLKTQKFSRLRLGIKTEALHKPLPADKFVLQKFNQEELKKLNESITEGLKAIHNIGF